MPGTGHIATAGPVLRPSGPLTREQAGQYVLALVNRDRAGAGLAAVEWDEAAARAGVRHAEDMAANGYTAHWGTDGSVPEQRYTEAQGTHLVQENAACFFDGTPRQTDGAPLFDAVELEKIETAFMAEVPPQDGHKKNILGFRHTGFGVGLAVPVAIRQPCMSQEFVDDYGEYTPLPARARAGEVVKIAGEVRLPVKFAAVGVARIEPATRLPAAKLNATYTYMMPKPFTLYSPPGYVTPKPVKVDGGRFAIEVPLSDQGRAGRYEISVWGTFPGDPALTMLSLRVVDVR
jgi:hypothetical protein